MRPPKGGLAVIFSRAVKRLRYSRLCLRRIDGHEVIYVSPMHSRFSRLRGRCRSAFLGHLDQVLYLPDHAPNLRAIIVHNALVDATKPERLERPSLSSRRVDYRLNLCDLELLGHYGRSSLPVPGCPALI